MRAVLSRTALVIWHMSAPQRCWALAVRLQSAWRYGRCHSAFTRTWSCGPLTLALTDTTTTTTTTTR